MRDVEQRALAGGLIVRDRGFVQMPEVVQLVAVDLLEDPALRSRPGVRRLRVDRACRVEIPVGLLRRGDLLDEAVDVGFQLGIGVDAQRVGRAFNHFVDSVSSNG